jgi:hypothetical protein
LGFHPDAPPNKCQELESKLENVAQETRKMELKKQGNTKLFIDYGHVWNSLVTIIISFTVELFGADINCGFLQCRFATYVCVDLSQGK